MYVRIEQLSAGRAPMPLPLESGFRADAAYRIIGMHSPSETADAYAVLSNERDELWFICTRHLRAVGVLPTATVLHMPLVQWPRTAKPWTTPPPREGHLPPPMRQMAAWDDAD